MIVKQSRTWNQAMREQLWRKRLLSGVPFCQIIRDDLEVSLNWSMKPSMTTDFDSRLSEILGKACIGSW